MQKLQIQDGRKKFKTLQQVLQHSFADKALESSKRCTGCDGADMKTTEKYAVMKPLPLVLILQFKRSHFIETSSRRSSSGSSSAPRKVYIKHAVGLDSTLDFMNAKYELMAVINFLKKKSHYTAFVKRQIGPNKVAWMEYDDQCVVDRTEQEVLVGKKAYVLFYRRMETASA